MPVVAHNAWNFCWVHADGFKACFDIAKVSVIGVGMKDNSGVASTMFRTLSEENINIILISTSEIRVSCVIEEKYAELAVRVLHTAFGLDKEDWNPDKPELKIEYLWMSLLSVNLNIQSLFENRQSFYHEKIKPRPIDICPVVLLQL